MLLVHAIWLVITVQSLDAFAFAHNLFDHYWQGLTGCAITYF